MAQSLNLKDVSQKLRIVKPKPPNDEAVSTEACQTTRVTALEDGINLNRKDGGLIRYADMSMMVVFQLDVDPGTWYLELFVYGQPTPFRISQKVVNYQQFLSRVTQRSKDNFFTFLLQLIQQTDSIYVDEHTLNFLKNRKVVSFPDFKFLEEYTKQLWFQLITWMKFRCNQCGEVYWVDDAKITPQGAKTKCVKCQNIIMVQKRERPAPLTAPTSRKAVTCPHCGYENVEGAQFCAMCQESLIPHAKTPPPLPSKTAPTDSSEVGPKRKASLEADLDERRPLAAQSKRRTPRYSLREIAESLQDDINTLDNKFAWFTKFSRIMQFLGSVFLIGGVLVGAYIRFVYPPPPLPAVFTANERWTYAGISAGVGLLLFLACIVVSNLIALNLEIERNTKVTTLLLQKLIDKED